MLFSMSLAGCFILDLVPQLARGNIKNMECHAVFFLMLLKKIQLKKEPMRPEKNGHQCRILGR